ncbi:CHAT domain-containing protein [Nonomuraea sp. NPDC050663]|uniref:CHAT domain-containing protein n=1 Tax=Nonomuraea sp. NPDC050663 TaxID=3364370 RepID=UPI00379E88E9
MDPVERAIALAGRDPRQGLAAMDELLAQDGPPDSRAALSYNRAAVLRVMGRYGEAEEAYRQVVAEFEGHPDQGVLFWVALALFNHASLMLDEDTAEGRLPALVARFHRHFHDSPDPRLRRRLRRVMTWEIEHFEALGEAERAAASRARLHDYLGSACLHVLTLLDGEGTAETVMAVLERLDPLLDDVRELGASPQEEWIARVMARPELLSMVTIMTLRGVSDGRVPGVEGDDDRRVVDAGMRAVASVYDYLTRDPEAYRLGGGPLEELLNAVDVAMGMTDAMELARQPNVVATLSPFYVQALCRESMALLVAGQWRQALRLHQLLLAAVAGLPASETGHAMARLARFRWLFVARQVLAQLPDARVLRSAAEAGRFVLESLDEGTPQYAEVLLALGALHAEPYGAGRPVELFWEDLRRWLERLGEEPLDPVEGDDGDTAMPPVGETMDVAEGHLRRALPMAADVQVAHVIGALLGVLRTRTVLGMRPDEAELRELAERMAATADGERYPQLLVHALVTLDRMPDDELVERPVERIAAEQGRDAAIGVLTGLAQLLARHDPARGRALFARSAAFVLGLEEEQRVRLLLLHAALLIDQDAGVPGGERSPAEAAADLAGRASAGSWSAERHTLALIAAVESGVRGATDLEGALAWIALLNDLPQPFGERHHHAIAYLAAGWLTRLSTAAFEAGNRADAVTAQVSACAGFLSLGLADAAQESLTIIARLVADQEGLARTLAGTLGQIALWAENLVGTRATPVLQTIWAHAVHSERDDVDALFACLQWAKGARFAAAWRGRVPYDWEADPEGRQLLESVSWAPERPRDQLLDSVTLVTPYSERLESRAPVRENLEHTFDARVQRAISARAQAGPQLLDSAAVTAALPEGTVLLWMYLGVIVVCARDMVAVTTQPGLASQAYEVHAERVRVLDDVQLRVELIRDAVLAEPGSGRAHSPARAGALDVGWFLGPAADLLRERAGGHLLVVPHGPFHFAPLHLCHLDGRPLADSWTVSYLPNLALLDQPVRQAAGRTRAAAFGFPRGEFGFEPIPEAEEEALAITRHALVGDRATRQSVLRALTRSGRFHLATHGLHNVTAPAFQCLYAADGPINAYELQRLDLGGLDLVTLSACETALGRYDLADNLRGIPAALLSRGARTIVGTLWPVESTTSRDFFTTFHASLEAGKLAAFAHAQRQTRAAHPEYRDWGAFYYTGEWR